jgi:hypothetical protein
MTLSLVVLHTVVLVAATLNAARAQNGLACQAGIEKDNNTLAQMSVARKKHTDAIDTDDFCGQLKASRELLVLTKARLAVRNQITLDCEGFRQTDGALIVEHNKAVIDEVNRRMQSLEKQAADEQEDCKQADQPASNPQTKDPGAFDLNSPGMQRCQASLNRCLSSARASYDSCAGGVCANNNACLSKCSNDSGARSVRCNVYGSECFKDPNHNDAKLISAIGAPLP